MRKLLIATLACLAFAVPVQAQTIEQVRTMANYVLQVSEYTEDSFELFVRADEADLISASYLDGTLDQQEALRQLEALSAEIDTALRASRSRALSLSSAPSGLGPHIERLTNHVEPVPLILHNAVNDFLSVATTYFRNEINGTDTDYNGFLSARYRVLATYSLSLGNVNTASAESIRNNNPNHFYLKSIGANFRMTALTFELARRRMGASPALDMPDDLTAAFAEEMAIVRENVRLGRNAHNRLAAYMRGQIEISSGIDRTRWETLLTIMSNFPEAFDNEIDALDLFANHDQRARPLADWDGFDLYLQEIGNYEIVRDELMLARQQAVAQLQ